MNNSVDVAAAAPGSPRFSANLGFLWTDLDLPNAIRSAAAAGFDAVEFHQPFAYPAEQVGAALAETGLGAISLNTGIGASPGDFGLTAVPGRTAEARALIDEAVEYAAAINCRFVSAIAGHSGRTTEAGRTYRENLAYASDRAGEHGLGVLIEPLNSGAGEGYHLLHVRDGAETVAAVGAPNLFVMADTFHVMKMDGDLGPIVEHLDSIGHIQISGWPDRGEPGGDDPDQHIDFATELVRWIEGGYGGCYGAEYTPRTDEASGLGWLRAWVAQR